MTPLTDNRDAVAGALIALGGAYRGDWSMIDGRTTRDELNGLAAALTDDEPVTYEALCASLGVCHAEHCWYEHCSTATPDRLCAHSGGAA